MILRPHLNPWYGALFFGVIFLLAYTVWRLRVKVKIVERRLEYEMNDVQSIANVVPTEERMRMLEQEQTMRASSILQDY